MDALVARPLVDARSAALLALLGRLRDLDYDFVTPTPATHERVRRRRPAGRADALRDIFGWSRPFTPDLMEPEMLDLARRAGIVRAGRDGLRLGVGGRSVDGRAAPPSAPARDREAGLPRPRRY